MNFTGGLTLIIHSAIIIFKWFIKRPLQFLIVSSILGLLIFGATMILQGAFGANSNYSLIKSFVSRCENTTSIVDGEKYVILRIDDIQAHLFRDVSIKMIDAGLNRGMVFTLGVIPLGLDDDEIIVNYLKNNSCNLEIALHGWNNRNDTPEFGNLSELAARNKIKQGKEVLEKTLGKTITTFIPPNNVFSEGSSKALKKEGFTVVSSDGDSYFDYSATTYNFVPSELDPINLAVDDCKNNISTKSFCLITPHMYDSMDDSELNQEKYSKYLKLLDTLEKEDFKFTHFEYSDMTNNLAISGPNPVDLVIKDCKKDLDSKGFCVIMIHPQDYMDDGELNQEKYSKYLKLLDTLEKEDFQYTTMKDYFAYLKQKNRVAPSW